MPSMTRSMRDLQAGPGDQLLSSDHFEGDAYWRFVEQWRTEGWIGTMSASEWNKAAIHYNNAANDANVGDYHFCLRDATSMKKQCADFEKAISSKWAARRQGLPCMCSSKALLQC